MYRLDQGAWFSTLAWGLRLDPAGIALILNAAFARRRIRAIN